jgi:hypothetical protein
VRLAAGTKVRVRTADPAHHTRVPRYVRGHVGEIVEYEGDWPLPDDRARGIEPAPVAPVYAVRFPAAALWGEGNAPAMNTPWGVASWV